MQTAPEVAVLEAGRPVDRELSAGQKHLYQISLAEDQYLRVEIQQDMNLVVSLRLPSGENLPWAFEGQVFQRDWEFGHVAESSGIYRLEVSSGAKSPVGHYVISVKELRPATDNDRAYHLSRKFFAEYWRLHREGKYLEARGFLMHSLEIREKLLGPDHLYVAVTLGHWHPIMKTRVTMRLPRGFGCVS